MMKMIQIFFFALLISCLLSCELAEDTDLNPVYFVECEIDGQEYRAQTNDEAFIATSQSNPNSYTITGHDIPKDFHVDFYLFRSLGEGKIHAGTQVNSLLTSIALFMGEKSYSAIVEGGDGCVTVNFLSKNESEGTFEGTLVEIKDKTEKKVITNGSFKVKTKG